jgi:hypothetical protein
LVKREQLVARKVALRKLRLPDGELVRRGHAAVIAHLHTILGNREVARLLGGKDNGAPPRVSPDGLPAIQRESKPESREEELARMREAFKRGGITEEMIRGERRDGFINYDEETGTAKWEQITYAGGPASKPKSREEEMARMREAFKRGGITEEMIRGERRDGFINYDEETGTAKWEQITYAGGPASKPAGAKKARSQKR